MKTTNICFLFLAGMLGAARRGEGPTPGRVGAQAIQTCGH